MGVHGLWDLLAPVGRRVSVETLAGKKLAIDASIWMIQFMKAMRDEKGEMVRNAHILGFFRRICKLLYLRTKPVFVFDGGTPALKRRTVVARRRQRENAQAKIRKTAEKLLLNQLKAMRLKELAADLEKQRAGNDIKGKRPIIQESVDFNEQQHDKKTSDKAGVGYTQEELDEMVAASIAAEEDERLAVDGSTSGVRVYDGEGLGDADEDEDEEEIILPEMQGKVDPAILASLPPSMQLDLLVQMRERLMAENRQKYQKVKKAPERFSELQIQSYLKTVAFRREIDAVQKTAAGRGIGGIQTSRIASEANREFIFSSSFIGDKRVLSSAGQEGVRAEQNQPSTSNLPNSSVDKVESSKRSTPALELNVGETAEAFHDGVETYTDERGRVRVSRLRALGIRMTRDLQRNLDLMKEIDKEKEANNRKVNNTVDARNDVIDIPDISQGRNEEIFEVNDDVSDTSEARVSNNAIEISFEDNTHEQENEDDNFFSRLVAGDNSASAKQSSTSAASECEWEEGVVEGVNAPNIRKDSSNDDEGVEWEDGSQDIQFKPLSLTESRSHVSKGMLQEESDIQEAIRLSLERREGEEDIEWENGTQDIQLKPLSRPGETESRSHVSKGLLQEESDIQEAIKRSLEEHSTYVNEPHGDHRIPEKLGHVASEDDDVMCASEQIKKPQNKSRKVDVNQPFIGSIDNQGYSAVEGNSAPVIELTHIDRSDSKLNFVNQGCSSGIMSEKGLANLDSMPSQMGSSMGGEHEHPKNVGESGNEVIMKDIGSSDREEVSLDSNSLKAKSAFTELFGGRSIDHKSADQNLVNDDSNRTSSDVLEESQASYHKVKTHGEFGVEEEETANGSPLVNISSHHDITEEDLNEEMMFLDKERDVLSSKQRKLERNAESVSSEMFAECQELLQMFGLPYIIAPMEAEAQCAFMELSNLVDGVVTDDSDAFLFGARNVYKNIFDDRKYVETYFMKDIEDELGLDREKLIHMALLLGSDYTEGISGIGIVNAIEVVNAFPGKDGLREFREWIESPDPAILGVSAGKSSKKKGDVTHSGDDGDQIKQIFMDKHRNVSKNWHIPSSFPSDMVISAYDSPQVDKSTEPFSWGKPDLFVLRKLCWEKFGWNNTKADELLLPVLKEYNKHETQLRLEAFYTFNERFAKIRSKRIKKAVKGISGKKRKSNQSEADETDEIVGVDSVNAGFTGPIDSSATQRQVKPRLSRKNPQRNEVQSTLSDDNKVIATRESNVRGRRGRGRGQPNVATKRKRNTPNSETESIQDDDSDKDKELQFDSPEGSSVVRRSGRTRKTVNYDESYDQRDVHESQLDIEEVTESPFTSETLTKEPLNEDSIQAYSADESKKVSMEDNIGGELGEEINDDQAEDRGESSKSYLLFGGGFCEEENDNGGDRNELEADGQQKITETSHFESVVEENRESLTAEKSSLDMKEADDEVEASEKGTAPGDDYFQTDETGNRLLRAMPGLRRKKPRT